MFFDLAKTPTYCIVWSDNFVPFATGREAMSLSVTFLTHGTADNTRAGQDDDRRELSVVGAMKVRDRRRGLGNPKFQMVVHSPALRTEQTARILAGLDENARTIVVPELSLRGQNPSAWEDIFTAIQALGRIPFRDYLKSTSTAKALVEFGQRGNYALKNVIGAVPDPTDRGNVLVIGHNILVQAICHEMCYNSIDLERIQSSLLGDCEGFGLVVNHENETRLATIERSA